VISRGIITVQSIKELGFLRILLPIYGQVKVLEETTWNFFSPCCWLLFLCTCVGSAVRKFAYPFIIMLTLPLSVPFALLSLWITGRALSLWSALGMFLLLGS